jgi:hypothetical protein
MRHQSYVLLICHAQASLFSLGIILE